MPSVVRRETFSPILLASESLNVSLEQQNKIRDILEIGASDSRFAAKMYDAIWHVLTGGSAIPPVIESLTPSSAVLGSPSFVLRVVGSGFDLGSKIVFAGQEEPTTLVNETEVTTIVDMSVWLGPDVLPVTVLNSNGVVSDPMMFEFTSPAARSAKKIVEQKPVYPTPLTPHGELHEKKLAAEEHHDKGK